MRERQSAYIDIKRGQSVIKSVLINERCKRIFKLMEQDCIILEFYAETAIEVKLGDYIQDESFGRFVIADIQHGEYQPNDAVYKYTLTFVAEYWTWKNWLHMLTYTPLSLNGASGSLKRKESTWNLTSSLDDHLEAILRNLSVLGVVGYNYNTAGCKKANEVRFISYDGVDVIAALNLIAEQYECEWWIVGKTIFFGKCETGSELILDVKTDLSELSIQDNRTGYANCIYAYGSDKNIPVSYRKDLYLKITGVKQDGDKTEITTEPPLRTYMFEGSDANDPITLVIYQGENHGTKDEAGNSIPVWLGDEHLALDVETGWKFNLYGVGTELRKGITFTFDRQLEKIQNISLVAKYYLTYIDEETGEEGSRELICATKSEKSQTLSSGDSSITFAPPPPDSSGQQQINVPFIRSTEIIHRIKKGLAFEIDLELELEGFVEDVKWSCDSTEIRYFKDGSIIDKNNDFVLLESNEGEEFIACQVSYVDSNNEIKEGVYAEIVEEFEEFKDNDARIVVYDVEGVKYEEGINSYIKVEAEDSIRMPDSYYTDTLQDPASVLTIGENRLRLPLNECPDGNVCDEGVTTETAIEKTIIFEDIYPKMVLYVESVETKQKQDKDSFESDGSEKYWNWTEYTVTLKTETGKSFTFKKEYIIAGNELAIQFLPAGEDDASANTHMLAGMIFGAAWKDVDDVSKFTIVRNEDFGAKLPNETLCPKVGDKCTLIGWNVKVVESSGILDAAEQELLKATIEYKEALADNPFTFGCTLKSDFLFGDAEYTGLADSQNRLLYASNNKQLLVRNSSKFYEPLREGQKVKIMDETLRGGECSSRIIGYEYKLDRPWDSPKITVGETQAYSRLAKIEKQITQISQ